MYRHRRSARRWGSRGFTLIELMVTVVVLMVLLTVGASYMGYIIANNQRVAAVNTLMAMLNLARSEAVKRASEVTLCPADPADVGEDKPCDTNADWADGYIVLIGDEDTDKPEILRVHPGVVGSGLTVTGTRDAVTYLDDGSATGSQASFTFCDTRGLVDGRRITVNASGRPMVRSSATCP